MKILIATGIYTPEIGGTATYTEGLRTSLSALGHSVQIVTYASSEASVADQHVTRVPRGGLFFMKWIRMARCIRLLSRDADFVIALSSVSAGIPLMLSGIPISKRVLRLGGEFFWERATDAGSLMSLREWMEPNIGFWKCIHSLVMPLILRGFAGAVYSTDFQHDLHRRAFWYVPPSHTIENATSVTDAMATKHTAPTEELKLLFVGRFVGFKNLPSLIRAMSSMPMATLTIIGSGPMEPALRRLVDRHALSSRVRFLPPVRGAETSTAFTTHDLLILPSVTEISPNVALEAIAEGLPVLLTDETGYRADLSPMLMLRPLRTPEQIANAVAEVRTKLPLSDTPLLSRTWSNVAEEWIDFLFFLSQKKQ
jgi:glycosyltransferase involved in cell wall biosynthesis